MLFLKLLGRISEMGLSGMAGFPPTAAVGDCNAAPPQAPPSRSCTGDRLPPLPLLLSILSDRFSVLRLANSIPLGSADGLGCDDDVDSLADRYWDRLSVWHSVETNEGLGGLSGLGAAEDGPFMDRLSLLLSKMCRAAAVGLLALLEVCWSVCCCC